MPITLDVTVYIPELREVLEAIARLEKTMGRKFDAIKAKLAEAQDAFAAFEARESAEDQAEATRSQEAAAAIAALRDQVAALQAQLDAGGLSDEEEAEILRDIVDLQNRALAQNLPTGPGEPPAPTE